MGCRPSQNKKRKAQETTIDEVRTFQDSWTDKFLFYPTPRKELSCVCLICNKVIKGYKTQS